MDALINSEYSDWVSAFWELGSLEQPNEAEQVKTPVPSKQYEEIYRRTPNSHLETRAGQIRYGRRGWRT